MGSTAIKFYKLLDLLNKQGISKGELQRMAGFSSATMAKLSKGEVVTTEVVSKICDCLNVQPGDIMEFERSTQLRAIDETFYPN